MKPKTESHVQCMKKMLETVCVQRNQITNSKQKKYWTTNRIKVCIRISANATIYTKIEDLYNLRYFRRQQPKNLVIYVACPIGFSIQLIEFQ